MSLLNSIDRDHVLTAMETWDSAGGAVYQAVRGDKPTHVVRHQGREYDASAIAGIAHGLATGRTLSAGEIPGGGAAAAKTLVRLGFEIRDDSPPAPPKERAPRRTATRASGVRTTGTPRPTRTAASDRPDTLCPRCYIAVPASGVCDNCD